VSKTVYYGSAATTPTQPPIPPGSVNE